ncbi:hypothetical protein D1BOALGB6SA_1485 [Olavius sp. associated proteobacterium Delta 1]|nr:hypothetical protein D1BOALGB6SA_1485 [Olavius sp. associated proteobacterium Delta 1]
MIRGPKNEGLVGKLKDKLYTDYYFFVNDDLQRANIAGEYAFYAMAGALVLEAVAVEGYIAVTAYGPGLNLAIREAISSYLPGVPDATIAGLLAYLTSVADNYIDFDSLKDKALEILFGPCEE